MSSVDNIWSDINRDFRYIDKISQDGQFIITAEQIKKYKEPRLVTKFDSSEDLPQIFKDNNLSILPISRGSYIISDIKTFMPLDEVRIKPIGIAVTDTLTTARLSNISSESQAINYAISLGLIEDFVEDQRLVATLDSRQGSGQFNFTIDKHSGGNLPVFVENAQIEIDKCLEGVNSIVIIEAKKDRIMPDFMERQLYYPYRMIRAMGGKKEIKNLFFSYNNGIIDIRQYGVEDYMNYNSMTLVKQSRFFLYDSLSKITNEVIYQKLKETPIIKEPDNVPFPQANTFDRVVSICEKLRLGAVVPNDLTFVIGVTTTRQAYYYVDAAIYLGLVKKKDGLCSLTTKGKNIQKEMPYPRILSYMMCILSYEVFRETFMMWLQNKELPTQEQVIEIMKRTSNIQVFCDNVYTRRASTVRKWVKWIIQNLS